MEAIQRPPLRRQCRKGAFTDVRPSCLAASSILNECVHDTGCRGDWWAATALFRGLAWTSQRPCWNWSGRASEHLVARPTGLILVARLQEAINSSPGICADVPCELRCQVSFQVSAFRPKPERHARRGSRAPRRAQELVSVSYPSMRSVAARRGCPGVESSEAWCATGIRHTCCSDRDCRRRSPQLDHCHGRGHPCDGRRRAP